MMVISMRSVAFTSISIPCQSELCPADAEVQASCGCCFCKDCVVQVEPTKIDQRLVWRCLHCNQHASPAQFRIMNTNETREYRHIREEMRCVDRKGLLVASGFLFLVGMTAIRFI